MRAVLHIGLLIAVITASGRAQEWPQWRGPSANGVADVASAPVRWSATDGVRWKTALVGHGTSTPVIADDRIFLTGQIGAGPIDKRGAQFPDTRPATIARSRDGRVVLVVQALHLEDGRTLWEHRFPAVGPLPAVHRNHNLATPSVATDGTLLFAWFGTGQLLAFDVDGRLVWERHLGQEYGPFEIMWGHGSSPALYDDVVILLCDHATGGYLVALDKRTGEERWKVDRGPGLRSYSTPLAVVGDDREELIVNSSKQIEAFDPKTGARLWHAGLPVELTVGMPVYRDGMLFTTRGYASSPYLALATGGLGDVSDTHIRWRHPTRAPYVSSLLLYDGLLYMATENGVLTVTDATSGAIVWRERLGGVFTASPVAASGHVYFLNESGETVVLRPGREPTVVSRNRLGERSLASPAVVEGRILIRTDQHLFCIDGQNAS